MTKKEKKDIKDWRICKKGTGQENLAETKTELRHMWAKWKAVIYRYKLKTVTTGSTNKHENKHKNIIIII